MITTPLGILLGLSPAQSIATGKFSGLSVTAGSLIGMRKSPQRISKKRVIPVMLLAFVCGLVASRIITSLDNDTYRLLIAVLLLLMIPVLFVKKIGISARQTSKLQKIIGGFLLSFALLLQGSFSTGLGTLVNLVLMGMFGMTATEASITKRWSALILNTTVIFGVIGSGLIAGNVVIVAMVSTFVGSYIGGKVAIRKGDAFIMDITLLLIFASAVSLILSI